MPSVNIESPGDGYQAKVDSGGRLFTKSDCSPHTLTTTRGAYTDTGVATLSETGEKCYLILQNRGTVALLVNMNGDAPDSGDFSLGPGESLTFPVPFSTAVKGKGVGGSGSFVAIQASHP